MTQSEPELCARIGAAFELSVSRPPELFELLYIPERDDMHINDTIGGAQTFLAEARALPSWPRREARALPLLHRL